ncbi:hypothetical protein [Gellertiella hungarica]|uniref:DUF1508 domain-containing protein n=1 Tax=Gellertiella hungarica TaxID=1572859 RepID=A0A7W6NKH0_9HYPH|nr:hypothetical protein [Gellertiella hungarica]MBB4064390.1 hypothetical protein [Gellertiella hungarica]
MDQDKKPLATVNVLKKPDGSWWFAMTWRGVTQPLQGPFRSQVEAAAGAQIAIKALEGRNAR